MPGIIGIIGNKANAVLLREMCEKINYHSYQSDQYNVQGVSLARVHHGYVNKQHQPVFSGDNRHVCVMTGEIFGIDGLPEGIIENDIEVFLDLFIKEGLSLLPKVNGQYSACIYDFKEQTAYLISDR